MRLLRLVCAVLAAGLALAAPAGAADGMEVGLLDDGVFVSQSWYHREAALKRAQRLGVTRLRVNVLWSRVVDHPNARRPPEHPSYDWRPFDTLIEAAASHGIRLQLTLAGTAPRWAAGNHRIGNVRPDSAAFARFAGAAARHFSGLVDRYAIWNEPNWHTWLQPSASCAHGHWGLRCDRRLASLYRALYRRASVAIRDADPTAQVLFGELAPQARAGSATPPLTLVRDVTCSRVDWSAARPCAPLVADGVALHPYAFTVSPFTPYGGPGDVTISTLPKLTSVVDRLAERGALVTPDGRSPDLYLTEHGYFSSGRRGVDAATRARWLTESFEVALANPRVRELVQYLLVTPPAAKNTFPTQIMDRRGDAQKPYTALQRWARRNRRHLAAPKAPNGACATPAAGGCATG